MVAGAPAGFGFACIACGRCCNSPPRVSLAELFRHQHVFIGSLAVVPLSAGGDAARSALWDRIAFRVPQALAGGGISHVAVMPQGYDYDSQARCPALQQDGACALHATGKPAQCAAVPLDPLAPDVAQDTVLAERMGEPAWREAGCLAPIDHGTHKTLTRAGAVVDAAFAGALAGRRAGMMEDRDLWGQAVFETLTTDWGALRAALGRVGAGGFLALPVSAAVASIAARAPAARPRCAAFLQAQMAAIEVAIDAALRRRLAADKPTTQRLRAWLNEYRFLLSTLGDAQAMPAPGPGSPFDTWLGQTKLAA